MKIWVLVAFCLIPLFIVPAFATTYSVSIPEGSGVSGCEETNECFSPYLITIDVGDTVLWTNDDSVAHAVTSGNPTHGPDGVFDSSLFMAGDSFSHTFDSTGLIAYYDPFHPWMQGIVRVTEKESSDVIIQEPESDPCNTSALVSLMGPISQMIFQYKVGYVKIFEPYKTNENFEEYLQGIDYNKSEKISEYVNSILDSEDFAVMYFEKDLDSEEEKLMIQVSEKYLEYLYDGKNRLTAHMKTDYLDKKNEMNALPMQDSRLTICGDDKIDGLEELESTKDTMQLAIDLYVTLVIEDWEKNLQIKKQSLQLEDSSTIKQTTKEQELQKSGLDRTGQIGLKKGDWVKYNIILDTGGEGFMSLMMEGMKSKFNVPETVCSFNELEWFKIKVIDIVNNKPVFEKSLFCSEKEIIVEDYGGDDESFYIPIDVHVGDIVHDGSDDPPKVIGIEEKQYGGKKIQVIKLHSEIKEIHDTGSFTGSKTHYFDKTSGLLLESDMKIDTKNVPFMGDLDVEMGFVSIDYNIPRSSSVGTGGGCLIATATYGSELAPQIQMLREIRDNSLLQTQSGQSFMQGFNQFYYSFSPTIADYERQNPIFKEIVKVTITPLLTSLSLLNYVNLDSEESVLGYGVGIITLNIVMYFVAPAIIISKIRIKI